MYRWSLPQQSKTAGLTIVEFLVYISVLVLIMASSVTFLFSLQDILTEYQLETELYRGGTAALEQIVLSLRQADSFDATNSVTQPSTSGVLVLNGSTTIEFARVSNELQLSIDGELYGDITSEAIAVNGFTVYRYRTTAGEFVRVELNLEASRGPISRSTTFYGGSVLRGAI